MFQIRVILIFSIILSFTACSLNKNVPKDDKVYYFGFDERAGLEEDVARYLPFLDYLEKETHLHFALNFIPNNSSIENELKLEPSDFTITGFLGLLEAETVNNEKVLVRGINSTGSATYKSIFVTRKDSNISSIKDIKGTKLAFGSIYSTQGHLIPRIVFEQNNISLKDLQSYIYTGSHKACAQAVISGQADVCAMQDKLARELASKNLVKIIYISKDYPSSLIAVNSNVPSYIAKKVKKALLSFDPQGKDKKGLHNWNLTEMPLGFVDAKSSDYDSLRQIAKKINILKFIKNKNIYELQKN